MNTESPDFFGTRDRHGNLRRYIVVRGGLRTYQVWDRNDRGGRAVSGYIRTLANAVAQMRALNGEEV
jgi:hypothetical protein